MRSRKRNAYNGHKNGPAMPKTDAVDFTQPLSGPSYDLRRQQTLFSVITLFVLAMLLLLHVAFAVVLGEPSVLVIAVLGISFALRLVELGWLQTRTERLSEFSARVDGVMSIASIFGLALLLAWLTNRNHSPYQVLLILPVLQAACLFRLVPTILTIMAADGAVFLWLHHYFALHPPPDPDEYLEGGMFAVVVALVGVLMWVLMRILRARQSALDRTLSDLQSARERLVQEEKLAAVGRLASGIAHEIRNPVAMITSALATAADGLTDAKERDEMFSIADRQAKRLEKLTTEFLSYARPSTPRRSGVAVEDLIGAVEAVARIRAEECGIQVSSQVEPCSIANIDASQVEGALLNLALNAMQAIKDQGEIHFLAEMEDGVLRVQVRNSGPAISEPHLERIFEPFFTTRPNGTGLGLAIAKGVARAHGGDLWVSRNDDGDVVFTMTLMGCTPVEAAEEEAGEQDSHRR
jgi:signal transduction histidine kinase